MAEPSDSHNRCPSKRRLVDRHYEIFVDAHPRIRSYFSNVDERKHKESLRTMHTALLMFARGDKLAGRFLKRAAKKHGPSGLNVPDELYELWLTSLIDAVRECDPGFDPEVEKAWREVGRQAVDYFLIAGEATEDSR